MGLANYYSKLVKGFTAVAVLLMGLCSPRASYRWDQAEQASFDALEAALTLAPILRVWESARQTLLITDASELVIGAILEQLDDHCDWHPVAFESRKNTWPGPPSPGTLGGGARASRVLAISPRQAV